MAYQDAAKGPFEDVVKTPPVARSNSTPPSSGEVMDVWDAKKMPPQVAPVKASKMPRPEQSEIGVDEKIVITGKVVLDAIKEWPSGNRVHEGPPRVFSIDGILDCSVEYLCECFVRSCLDTREREKYSSEKGVTFRLVRCARNKVSYIPGDQLVRQLQAILTPEDTLTVLLSFDTHVDVTEAIIRESKITSGHVHLQEQVGELEKKVGDLTSTVASLQHRLKHAIAKEHDTDVNMKYYHDKGHNEYFKVDHWRYCARDLQWKIQCANKLEIHWKSNFDELAGFCIKTDDVGLYRAKFKAERIRARYMPKILDRPSPESHMKYRSWKYRHCNAVGEYFSLEMPQEDDLILPHT